MMAVATSRGEIYSLLAQTSKQVYQTGNHDKLTKTNGPKAIFNNNLQGGGMGWERGSILTVN